MGTDYIDITEAARISGRHVEALKKLLREGKIEGFKATQNGRQRWFVSRRSLNGYNDASFQLSLPGPKFYLKRRDPKPPTTDDDDEAQ